jgi:hypothetical protein
MHYVLVLMAVAIVAILVAIVFVAIGRGGEMAQFPNDYAPPEFGALAATDVALLRPPTALWGYHMQATDEALNRIALAISERDVRIASLERQLADLHGSVPGTAPPAPDPQAGSARPETMPGSGAGPTAGTGTTAGFARGPAYAQDEGSAVPFSFPPRGPQPRQVPSPAEPVSADPVGTGAAGATGPVAAARGATAPGGMPPEQTGLARGTASTGNAGLAGNTHAAQDPRAAGDASSRGSVTGGGSDRSGTGWPDDPDLPVPTAGPGAGSPGAPGFSPAADSGTAWPGWPGWPGAQAQPPEPHPGTQPEPPQSHPPSAASPRQQSDEEETW